MVAQTASDSENEQQRVCLRHKNSQSENILV
jgi:hypothetical protein